MVPSLTSGMRTLVDKRVDECHDAITDLKRRPISI